MATPASAPAESFQRSPAELQDLLHRMEDEGYELDNLDRFDQRALEALRVRDDAAEEEIHLLKRLDPSINGNVVDLLEDLTLYRQENMAKQGWGMWEFFTSIPGRIWGTIKAHPKTSVAIGATALIALGLYTEAGTTILSYVKAWIAKYLAANQVAALASGAGNAAEAAAEAAKGAVEAVGGALENIPPPPMPADMPTTIPGVDETQTIIDALERSG